MPPKDAIESPSTSPLPITNGPRKCHCLMLELILPVNFEACLKLVPASPNDFVSPLFI